MRRLFMASDCLHQKGYLSEEEAKKEARIMDRLDGDAYTSYITEPYQEESILNANGNIKLK